MARNFGIALVIAVVVAACASSTEDQGDNGALQAAQAFRDTLINSTGNQSFSLADAIEISAQACDQTVNRPEELLELAGSLGFASTQARQNAASAIWLGARNTCPDAFTPETVEAGPPFRFGSQRGAKARLFGTTPPPEFGDFLDTSVLDEPSWFWAEGQLLLLESTTELGGEQAVEHFQRAFADGWQVGEALGPVMAGPDILRWSIDVESDGWDGYVDVISGDLGDPLRDTAVSIFFAAKSEGGGQ